MTVEDDALDRLERQLGWLLVSGVSLSAVCLAAGVALQLLSAAPTWSARLLAAGLMILMATPMLRVLVSMVEYVRIREWFFVITTLVVFAELILGLIYAAHR